MQRIGANKGEYYSLLLLSAAGAMFMVGANDLVMVFIALELLSIPLYVLAAFRSTDSSSSDVMSLKSEEAGLKYFILGAFSSAFFVYGSALVFGATGTTSLPEIFAAAELIIADSSNSATALLLMGASLIFVGLGFKVAVVPFHMWTPDVYEGSPTPVTAFMSVAAKVGGFAALLRIMIVGLSGFALTEGGAAAWQNTVWIVAALTLLLGNFVAISQLNLKRMLAYSSIAHAGYYPDGSSSSRDSRGGERFRAGRAGLSWRRICSPISGAFAVVMTLEQEDGSPARCWKILSGLA